MKQKKFLGYTWLVRITGAVLFLLFVCTYRIQNSDEEPPRNAEDIHGSRDVVFVIIICQEKGGTYDVVNDITRQLSQTEVLMKSAAVLTSSVIRFIILVDPDHVFHTLLRIINSWPKNIRSKLVIEKRPVSYPEGTEHLRPLFRVCATASLFLPFMLQDLDSVVFIDTDVIFMRPPEELWGYFKKFEANQMVAMAPCLNHYGTNKSLIPFYGETGLNSGVLMLNLTKLKGYPGGWTESCILTEKIYRMQIQLADQDIMNIMFSKNPEYLYELDCTWNYRAFQCSGQKNLCPLASKKGVSLLHGNALTFVSGQEMKLQLLYESWRNYNFRDSLEQLMKSMKENLQKVKDLKLPSKCVNMTNIDQILTYGLGRYLTEKQNL